MTNAEDGAAPNHDGLTGLLNYSGLSVIADQAIARSERDGERLSLACFRVISVDPAGGAERSPSPSLVELSGFLRTNLRASDTVARVTENELAALLPNTDGDRAHAAVRQLASVVLHEEAILDQSSIVEIGVATFDPSSQPFDLRAMLDIARLDMSFSNLRWSAGPPRKG